MSTTVTTHSTSVLVAPHSTYSTKGSNSSDSIMPPTHLSVSGMSGLLNSRNLDEKLVVATLATLDSGSASNLIKQDLKLIIQSRRKAEGKAEIQVEFKKPVKAELTSEELTKRARRRELNRLAARRSREKGQRRKDKLVEEIRELQSENMSLVTALSDLTEQRNSIITCLRQHMRQCNDYKATQSAAVGMSPRVLEMLGFPAEVSPPTPVIVKEEPLSFSASGRPLVYGFSGKPLLFDSSSELSPTGSETVLSSPPVPSPSGSTRQNLFFGESSKLLSSESSLQHHSDTCFILEEPVELVKVEPASVLSSETLCGSSSQESLPLDWSSRVPSTVSSSSEEDPSLHYQHKLMKHRKDFPKPAPVTSCGQRALLERSFSFPSSTSFSTPVVSVENQDAPLDLRRKHSQMDKSSENSFSSRLGLERRWSVDETCSQSTSQSDSANMSPSSSSSKDGSGCIASRYAKLNVDSCS